MNVHLLSQLSPSQTLRVTHFKLRCCFISSQNHQEMVWVFSSSLHMLWFVCYFLAVWVVIFVILCSIVLLFVCWVWWIVFDADFIWCRFVNHNVLIFVLCFGICWCLYSFGKWVWCFSGFYSICVYESLLVSVVLDYLSCITVFLVPLHVCASILSVLLQYIQFSV